jgi:hypothetical protein
MIGDFRQFTGHSPKCLRGLEATRRRGRDWRLTAHLCGLSHVAGNRRASATSPRTLRWGVSCLDPAAPADPPRVRRSSVDLPAAAHVQRGGRQSAGQSDAAKTATLPTSSRPAVRFSMFGETRLATTRRVLGGQPGWSPGRHQRDDPDALRAELGRQLRRRYSTAAQRELEAADVVVMQRIAVATERSSTVVVRCAAGQDRRPRPEVRRRGPAGPSSLLRHTAAALWFKERHGTAAYRRRRVPAMGFLLGPTPPLITLHPGA